LPCWTSISIAWKSPGNGGQAQGPETGAEGEEQAAGAGRDGAANRFAQFDETIRPPGRVKEMQMPSVDVHPGEQAAAGVPGGTFAQPGVGIDQEFGASTSTR